MVHWETPLFSLLMSWGATAAKDTTFYSRWTNHFVNEQDMYYHEATKVLQDLVFDEFSALYIQYHGCVWSEYTSKTNEQDYDEEDDDEEDVDELDNTFWYLGRTQAFRANAAYSLYAVKKGQPAKNPCSKAQYVNSFFTTLGIEGFAEPLGLEYEEYGATSTCEIDQDGGDEDKNEDEEYGINHGEQLYPNAASYVTGCSADGEFVTAKFQGAHCDGNHLAMTLENLGNLNQELEELGCYQIYGGETNNRKMEEEEQGEGGNDEVEGENEDNNENMEDDQENENDEGNDNNDNEENNDENMDENQDDEDNGDDEEENTDNNGDENDDYEENDGNTEVAATLLAYSASCSHSMYKNRCPDPYRIQKARERVFFKETMSQYQVVPQYVSILSPVFLFGALFMFCITHRVPRKITKSSIDTPNGAFPTKPMWKIMFQKTYSNISETTQSVYSRLTNFAEEEEDDEDDNSRYTIAEDDTQEVFVILPRNQEPDRKKYKRPRLANFSRFVGGKRNRKSSSSS